MDDELIDAFERGAIDPASFDHRAHLRVAWSYLRALPLEQAIARYVDGLKRLTTRFGVPHKFHATMTWAYLIVVHDAMQDATLAHASFDELVERRPELLDRHIVLEHYAPGELDRAEARARFVLPRRSA